MEAIFGFYIYVWKKRKIVIGILELIHEKRRMVGLHDLDTNFFVAPYSYPFFVIQIVVREISCLIDCIFKRSMKTRIGLTSIHHAD